MQLDLMRELDTILHLGTELAYAPESPAVDVLTKEALRKSGIGRGFMLIGNHMKAHEYLIESARIFEEDLRHFNSAFKVFVDIHRPMEATRCFLKIIAQSLMEDSLKNAYLLSRSHPNELLNRKLALQFACSLHLEIKTVKKISGFQGYGGDENKRWYDLTSNAISVLSGNDPLDSDRSYMLKIEEEKTDGYQESGIGVVRETIAASKIFGE